MNKINIICAVLLILGANRGTGQSQLYPGSYNFDGGSFDYEVILRKVFKDAYKPNVKIRMHLVSVSSELIVYFEGGNITTLSLKNTSVSAMEQRERTRKSVIKKLEGGNVLSKEDRNHLNPGQSKNLGNIKLVRWSQKIPFQIESEFTQLLSDALFDATYKQKYHVAMGGRVYHFYIKIKGKPRMSGYTMAPKQGSIPYQLADLAEKLTEYSKNNISGDELMLSIEKYKRRASTPAKAKRGVSPEKGAEKAKRGQEEICCI